MKRIVALILVAFSVSAWADEVSLQTSIEDLLRLTQAENAAFNMRHQLDHQVLELIDKMAQGKSADQLNAAQNQAIEHFKSQINQLFDENLSWGKVKEFNSRVYTESFTEAEIEELVDFYKTPLGQKMLTKMPVIIEATTRNTKAQLEIMLPRLEQIGQQFAREFAQAGNPSAEDENKQPKPQAGAIAKKKAAKPVK